MTRKLLAAAALSCLGGAASAQPVDIATLTCADLTTLDAEAIAIVFYWLDGYVGGQAEDTSFDLQRLLANMEGSKKLCDQDPSSTVMDVVIQAESDG